MLLRNGVKFHHSFVQYNTIIASSIPEDALRGSILLLVPKETDCVTMGGFLLRRLLFLNSLIWPRRRLLLLRAAFQSL